MGNGANPISGCSRSSRRLCAGIFGPALFALSVDMFGSSRMAVLSVIVFFILGGLVLTRVDVARGIQEAEAAERLLRQA